MRGARLVEVAKCALPSPPRPPFASSTRWPTVVRSATRLELAGLRILRVDQRADRHRDLEILAAAPGAQRAGAVAAALRLVVGIELEVDERVAMRIGDGVHGAADAAVAAVGSAARNELLTAEAERPAAAVPCLNVDVDFVDELHEG